MSFPKDKPPHSVKCSTERFQTGPDNDRFRDLIDLLLLRDTLATTDLPRVREACLRIFQARGKRSWPPTVTVYESWREAYREMARDIHFEIQEVEEAATLVAEMIAQIDSGRPGNLIKTNPNKGLLLNRTNGNRGILLRRTKGSILQGTG